MKTMGAKADFVELNSKPVIGLYQNRDKLGEVRYYYYYKNDKRVSATKDLSLALQQFFTSQAKPVQPPKLNQLSLSDCLNKYFAIKRDRELNQTYTKEVKRVFNEFKKIVYKQYVHQVSFQDIENYNETIHNAPKGTKKEYYVNQRITSIKTVFNAVIKKEEHKEDLSKLIDNLKLLDRCRRPIPEPQVISVEQFQLNLSFTLYYANDRPGK